MSGRASTDGEGRPAGLGGAAERLVEELRATPLAELPAQIARTVVRTGLFLDADRATLVVLDPARADVVTLEEWRAAGVEPTVLPRPPCKVPTRLAWLFSRLAEGGSFELGELSELPPRARGVRTLALLRGVRRALLAPLVHGEEVLGFLALERVSSSAAWGADRAAALERVARGLAHAALRERLDGPLRRRAERLQAALVASPDLVLAVDLEGRVRLARPAPDARFPLRPPPDAALVGVVGAALAPHYLAAAADAVARGELRVLRHEFGEDESARALEARLVPRGDDEVVIAVRALGEPAPSDVPSQVPSPPGDARPRVARLALAERLRADLLERLTDAAAALAPSPDGAPPTARSHAAARASVDRALAALDATLEFLARRERDQP